MVKFRSSIYRDPDGYRWVDFGEIYPGAPDDERIYLQAVGHDRLINSDGVDIFKYRYDPFIEEPALFRIFASLPADQHAILEFANQYGDLATYSELHKDGGLSLEGWTSSISYLRSQIEQIKELTSSIPASRRASTKHIEDLTVLINEILSSSTTQLDVEVTPTGMRLQITALSLLDVIYVQFVLAIVENKTYRNCEQCQKPFEVTPQINRADRIFCSDNCRVKSYQRRKRQAIAMRLEGRSMREIAKETNSNMKTVRNWVSGLEEKE
ncbi:MAG: hypothetical protein AB7G08_33015 [Hyphomicrobiaceae bacterium]